MKLAMIGSGYVGLVSGACFADFGHTVVCVDEDVRRIEALEHGEIPTFELGLHRIVQSNVGQRRSRCLSGDGPPTRPEVIISSGGANKL